MQWFFHHMRQPANSWFFSTLCPAFGFRNGQWKILSWKAPIFFWSFLSFWSLIIITIIVIIFIFMRGQNLPPPLNNMLIGVITSTISPWGIKICQPPMNNMLKSWVLEIFRAVSDKKSLMMSFVGCWESRPRVVYSGKNQNIYYIPSAKPT